MLVFVVNAFLLPLYLLSLFLFLVIILLLFSPFRFFQERWQSTSTSFDVQMATLLGDCLLAAAFLTYGGIFDHKIRRSLLVDWSETLETLSVPHRQELDMVEYLSKPSEQLLWRGYA